MLFKGLTWKKGTLGKRVYWVAKEIDVSTCIDYRPDDPNYPYRLTVSGEYKGDYSSFSIAKKDCEAFLLPPNPHNVRMTLDQHRFLKYNDHLTPMLNFKDKDIIVEDTIKDNFGQKYCYILTSDCHLQGLETWVKNHVA